MPEPEPEPEQVQEPPPFSRSPQRASQGVARPPSLLEACSRALRAARRLALDHFELAKLDAREAAQEGIRGLVLGIGGAILLSGAWFILTFAIAEAALPGKALAWRLLLVAAINFIAGAVLLTLAGRKGKNSDEEDDADREATTSAESAGAK